MTAPTLTQRALNRALLARQMLLRKETAAPLEVVERLAGLQAQQARPPFVGLWSRIAGFQREDLVSLVESRQVVRASLMRCTLHLMSTRDFTTLRGAIQPALTGAMRSILRDRLDSFAMEGVLAEARRLFAERPRTFTELRGALMERFPDADERAMGYAVRTQIPLVILPAEHPWGYRADGDFGLAEDWLGGPLVADPDPRELIRRYLAAFGPATVGDIQAWSGLAGLAAVVNALRPELAVFRDERKRELFDLPAAPRPPEETEVPARFIAEFDNLVLGHADRTRVIADAHRPVVVTKNGLVLGTILVDGYVAGLWKVARVRKTAVLTVTPFAPLSPATREELAAEGAALARFMEPEAPAAEVCFAEP